MQRDILVAYWLLFDEFEIGADSSLPTPPAPRTLPPTQTVTQNSHGSQPPKLQPPKSGRSD